MKIYRIAGADTHDTATLNMLERYAPDKVKEWEALRGPFNLAVEKFLGLIKNPMTSDEELGKARVEMKRLNGELTRILAPVKKLREEADQKARAEVKKMEIRTRSRYTRIGRYKEQMEQRVREHFGVTDDPRVVGITSILQRHWKVYR